MALAVRRVPYATPRHVYIIRASCLIFATSPDALPKSSVFHRPLMIQDCAAMQEIDIIENLHLPFLLYDSTVYPEPYETSFHHHPAWQLTAAIRGQFYFHFAGHDETISEGEWILISPGLPHSCGSHLAGSRASQLFLREFPPALLPEAAARLNLRRNYRLRGQVAVAELVAIDDLFLACRHGQMRDAHRRVLPLRFLMSTLSGCTLPSLTRRIVPAPMLAALAHLEKHFAEPLGIGDYAAIAGLSESRFYTLFRHYTGRSPAAFIQELRISCASSLLLEGCNIAESARRAGFSSPQYFCRCFKKFTNQTPGEFQSHPFK